MRAARIENGLVADLWEVPSLDCYGDQFHLVEAPEGVTIGTAYSEAAGFSEPVKNAATPQEQIIFLEATVTPRRLREAALGADDGWLAAVDAQISELRNQLTKQTSGPAA